MHELIPVLGNFVAALIFGAIVFVSVTTAVIRATVRTVKKARDESYGGNAIIYWIMCFMVTFLLLFFFLMILWLFGYIELSAFLEGK